MLEEVVPVVVVVVELLGIVGTEEVEGQIVLAEAEAAEARVAVAMGQLVTQKARKALTCVL